MSWQLLLLIATITLFCGLFTLLIRWPIGLEHTFSQHAAQTRSTRIYYVLIFLLTLPVIAWTLSNPFTEYYTLPSTFSFSIWLSAVLQIVCALIPETAGLQKLLHQTLAALSAVFLATAAFVSGLTFAKQGSALMLISFVIMVATALYTLKRPVDAKLAIDQLIYYGSFFGAVMYLTVVSL